MKADPEERFEALYGAHHQELLAFIRRRSTIGDAEDVVAETFVVAWRRIEDVPDPARGWLFAVARNILRNHERSHHRQFSLRVQLANRAPTYSPDPARDRKSTRLNSSHVAISYAVFCLKKKILTYFLISEEIIDNTHC